MAHISDTISTLRIPIFSAYSASLGSGLGCLQIHSHLQERQKDMWNILSERSTIIIPTKLNYVFYQHLRQLHVNVQKMQFR